ncbi:3-deoxy-D-manno-octulosonic acid transferase [Acinetobacter larvae]|uniref:3-deoxy-D-manno-octulosonic acid transferase n=1 Tax=Acinetobacter larvae TaxID=1789224 RepID=A0A1B2M382_9GAMM|nr:3-deoxy-D-manno-octulosonic acid transferase [Acinetobacter larvae]AOA59639.1 3-deoxy-D-manno-2-octulosonate transferase [Acinetobacter larvae]
MATPFWYNAALAIAKPLYRWRIKKRADTPSQYQAECLERFGPFQAVKNLHCIWFHAVSVGETNAAQPLIEHYLKQGHAVLVTNTTKTGQARAKALFLNSPYQALFQAVYLPADQRHLIVDFLNQYQPRLLALVETELWPNLLDQVHARHIPCLLINARLSEKSAQSYARLPKLTANMLKCLTQLLAQDADTQQRYLALGMPAAQSQIVGSIKYDIQAQQTALQAAQQLQQQWHLQHRKIVILASTHAPEERVLLEALKDYLQQNRHALCIVVPRHPERFEEVFNQIQQLALTVQRRSLAQPIQADTQVYLADSMGELWLWYALSQVAYVGGSLNEPGGGHNILEPLSLGLATVIGPNYFNFQSIVTEFKQAQAIAIQNNAADIAQSIVQCLEQPEFAAQYQQHAQSVLARNQGSLQRHIQAIDLALQPESAT